MTCHDDYDIDATTATPDALHRVVVGVDGGDASRAALRWAVRHGATLGMSIELVMVVEPDITLEYIGPSYPVPRPRASTETAEASAMSTLADVARREIGPGFEATTRLTVLRGSAPGHALARHAAGAAMLVVGSDEHPGLGFMLGATSHSVVRHGECPVVVVPASWATAAGAGTAEGVRAGVR